MTCIVGFVHKGQVTIGGDSAGVAGLDVTVRRDKKVVTSGEFAMGFTSSFRMGDILKHVFIPPKIKEKDETDLEGYMVRKFVTSLRKCFKENGYGKFTDSDDDTGGEFLVGIRGNLFLISEDFQVGQSLFPFDACGCGAKYALGSMFTNYRNTDQYSDKILEDALDAAVEFSGGVRGPFNYVTV